MRGYHTSGQKGVLKPMKKLYKIPPPSRGEMIVNKKNLPGQHLIVPADVVCPECEQPAGGVLVHVSDGVQKCRGCYAGVAAKKKRKR